jgi:hypothetical protein
MISTATKRSILRWVHLIFTIPILGYIYGEASEVQQYAGAVRFIFVPVIVLSGFWMYSGVSFAIIGVAVWLGAYRLFGFWAVILSQVALFIARKIWMMIRARHSPLLAVHSKQKYEKHHWKGVVRKTTRRTVQSVERPF